MRDPKNDPCLKGHRNRNQIIVLAPSPSIDNWQTRSMSTPSTRPLFRIHSVRRSLQTAAAALSVTTLSACASLPTSGPTVKQVVNEANANKAALPFTLKVLDAQTLASIPTITDPGVLRLAALNANAVTERADRIRPGDSLSISIFEIGVSLFGRGAMPATSAGAAPATSTAASQSFVFQVREDGSIDLPYIGTIHVSGDYPERVAAIIRGRLKSMSEHPEVTVSITETLRNAVYLEGAVQKSGRYRLTAAHERLLDAIALAGGGSVDPNELEVRVQRGDTVVSAPMHLINAGSPANINLMPGDRIELVRTRRSFTVFGASDKINQVYFETKDVTLAEAIARASGPSDYRANPRGVFLCRYELNPDGNPVPVVYQLNMMKMDSYFLSQRVVMRDKDVILFANSSGNMTQKFVNLISNLFSPAMAVRYAAQ